MSLACLGMFILASSSWCWCIESRGVAAGDGVWRDECVRDDAVGVLYGDADAHSIKQISVAIATGAHTHTAKQSKSQHPSIMNLHTHTSRSPSCVYVCLSMRTASSGVAIWLFAIASSRGSYHSAPVVGGLLALVLAALDVTALAKPEVLESVVRRAPTWEQLVAFRQRKAYFSNTRRAKQNAARLRGSCARRRRAEGRRRTSDGSMRRWSRRIWRIR